MGENWMSHLDRNLVWTNVILPGTHDSGAYQIDYSESIDPKLQLAALVKCYVEEWTLCQDKTIREQLRMGVRCFDLRLGYHEGDLWVCHTFTCARLQTILDAIYAYALFHPKEVLVLRMREDWENRNTFTAAAVTSLLHKIDQISKQCIRNPASGFTLGELWNKCRTIACVWTGNANVQSEYVLPAATIDGHWANTSDIATLESQINWNLQNRVRGTEAFYELSFTLTPSADDVKRAIVRQVTCRGTTDLRTYAAECKEFLMQCDDRALARSTSLVSVDFIDEAIARKVYMLNFTDQQ